MIRRVASDAHGSTPREQAVLDAHEAGEEIAAIAARLGLAERYCRQIITFYRISSVEECPFNRMVIEGSRKLAAACVASGRQFL